mgnify:FL=1
MLNDKTTEISARKIKLEEWGDNELLLTKDKRNVKEKTKSAEITLKDLQADMKALEFKLFNNKKAIKAGSYQLQKLQAEQAEFEKHQEIERLKAEQPNFLQCVEQVLLDKQAEQDKRLNFPLERKINANEIMVKLAQLEEKDFLQRNGYTESFHVYNNFRINYDARLGEIIEASISGIEPDGISDSFAQMANDFMKNRHIQTHLL